MAQGTVKFYNAEKGFGFIKSSTDQSEVFVHRTSLQNLHELREGEPVTYEMGEGNKGPMAVNVRRGHLDSAGDSE
jgi:cold shock protein